MIYLASPYTSSAFYTMEERYEKALHCTALLLNRGFLIYSPIVHCHALAVRHKLPRNFDFWMDYNLHMLNLAEKLMVLTLDGWRVSIGVTKEIEFARRKKLDIQSVEILTNDTLQIEPL